MDTYKVGIIGTGFGTKVQVPAMQANDRFEVVALSGRNLQKTKDLADSLNITTAVNNWKELLSMGLDMIVVSTPPYLHYEMAKGVLESNTHLLLEKPTTSNAYEAKKLYRLAEDRNLIGMLSHEFRWVPERAFVRDLLNSGEIGKIREVYMEQYANFGFSKKIGNFGWFWQSLYERGIIGALGSHLIDYLRFSTGKEFIQVNGNINTVVTHKTDDKGIKHKVTADTGFMSHFKMEDGVIGNMVLSSTLSNPVGRRIIYAGDKGTIRMEDKIYLAKTGEEWKQIEIPEKYNLDNSQKDKDARIPPYMKLLEQITKSLDEGMNYSPSLYDGWKNQQVIDGIKLSNKTGSRVTIID